MPRVDTIVKLAGGLGIEPQELVKGISWECGDQNLSAGGFVFGKEMGEANGSR